MTRTHYITQPCFTEHAQKLSSDQIKTAAIEETRPACLHYQKLRNPVRMSLRIERVVHTQRNQTAVSITTSYEAAVFGLLICRLPGTMAATSSLNASHRTQPLSVDTKTVQLADGSMP